MGRPSRSVLALAGCEPAAPAPPFLGCAIGCCKALTAKSAPGGQRHSQGVLCCLQLSGEGPEESGLDLFLRSGMPTCQMGCHVQGRQPF